MAILVNGSGFKFATGQIDADFFRGLTGGDGVFLQTGSNMAYSVPSANTVRILDGEFITNEGRRIQIKAGNYDDFAIPSGSQGVTTYYFIGYRFYIGTGEQEGYELNITDKRLHHEIYLSDARRVLPEKLRTVIRHPIKVKEN